MTDHILLRNERTLTFRPKVTFMDADMEACMNKRIGLLYDLAMGLYGVQDHHGEHVFNATAC